MELEEINVTYKKWLISFRLEDAQLYNVWGSDSTDNDNDKLWVDAYRKVVTFGDFQQTIEAILTSPLPLFDSDNTRRWALSIKDHGYSEKPTSGYVYNLDRITKQIDQIDFNDLGANSSSLMAELIDFLNLFGDYALQIDDKEAIQIWENASLRQFREYMYNAYFWTISPEELKHRQAELLRDYNAYDCEQSLTETLLIFRKRLQVYT